ncbi:MAG: hypothetical protein HY034_05035 [Nitrospirae bacterium]|nr:hypothetical protein [Nitrospirota bacterium]
MPPINPVPAEWKLPDASLTVDSSVGDTISKEHLPSEIFGRPSANIKLNPDSLQDIERDLITRVLKETQGNLHEAARRLNISRPTLYSKLKRFGIDSMRYE